jgi:hypothetical protein
MAKKTEPNKNKNEEQPNSPAAPPPRNLYYMAFLGIVLAAWMIWRLLKVMPLEKALLWGIVAGLAWEVFVLVLYFIQNRD